MGSVRIINIVTHVTETTTCSVPSKEDVKAAVSKNAARSPYFVAPVFTTTAGDL
jgi:hypothetical protein